jgi:hypothetical protein
MYVDDASLEESKAYQCSDENARSEPRSAAEWR